MTKLPRNVEVISEPSRGSFNIDEEFITDAGKRLDKAEKQFAKDRILSPPVIILPELWVRENLAGGSKMELKGVIETLNRKLDNMDSDLHFATRSSQGQRQIYVTRKREE